jgi:glycosyltransferase involved in cell wall biosynthesis
VATGVRVALVHEWLLTHGGSEEITGQLCRLFPEADLFTLVADPVPSLRALIGERRITTSFLQKIPGATKSHRRLLPLMPRAIESFDLTGYDLVISVSHAVAKGVRTAPGQPHLNMCCSPIRYAWDLREQYLEESGLSRGVRGAAARFVLDRLKHWDKSTAGRPTEILAISAFIAERIQRVWGRESGILYPPVATEYFTPPSRGVARTPDLWVTASRMVPYKRIPLIVEAFAEMPTRRLIVIGDGPEMQKVRAAAAPNVTLVGHASRDALREWLRCAQGFVFAAEEDFGIAPVEAMACGTPVVAYGRGGVRETVVGLNSGELPGTATGVFYEAQNTAAIAEGVRTLEGALATGAVTAEACRTRAEEFSEGVFQHRAREAVERLLGERGPTGAEEKRWLGGRGSTGAEEKRWLGGRGSTGA